MPACCTARDAKGSRARAGAFARTCAVVVLATVAPQAGNAAGQDAAARRVATAQQLVEQLDLNNTSYEHGQGHVRFSAPPESRTDCSGFIDHLLMHDDGYTPADFKHWLGSGRPNAARYHDAIVEGRGFSRVTKVADLKAGDLLAIKYLTRTGNSGHLMLAVDAPRRVSATPPQVDGTTQWVVTVVDSSESGHGPTDTRHKRGAGGKDHDGLGRGVFRVYADGTGEVAGFAWSTTKASHYVVPSDEHLVMGRFEAGFRP